MVQAQASAFLFLSIHPPKSSPCIMTDLAIRLDTSRNSGEERDIRVEDYLNDKLQTIADLENLDSLLENVRNQHLLLTQQACLNIRV